MAQPKIAAEYIGTGTEHLGGIPASDLTEDDVAALPDERRTELLANAAGDHAIYKLHGNDIKAEAKEIAAGDVPPGDGSGEALPPLPDATDAPSADATAPKGSKRAAEAKEDKAG